VPLAAEQDYWLEYRRLLTDNGLLYLEVQLGEESQGWQTFAWREETYIRFDKVNSLPKLEQQIERNGFEILQRVPVSESLVGLFLQRSS
jgi:hypothetical protein